MISIEIIDCDCTYVRYAAYDAIICGPIAIIAAADVSPALALVSADIVIARLAHASASTSRTSPTSPTAAFAPSFASDAPPMDTAAARRRGYGSRYPLRPFTRRFG